MYIEPPHYAWDRSKVASMLNTLRNGKMLPSIMVDEEGQAYSGSHRLEAICRAKQFEKFCDIEIKCTTITMDERARVLASLGEEPDYEVYDFDVFVGAAHSLNIGVN